MSVSVRLPAKLERLVTRVARRKGQTKSEVVRMAILALEANERKEQKGPRAYEAMKHLIGCASGGPPDLSVKTGQKFREQLVRRRLSR